jgi:glyoxylase-like metal-dependent hydrolase (beta-lactamase superfamily II)
MVEDPRKLYELRYNFLAKDHGLGFAPEPSPDAGEPCKVDLGFKGGETLRLDDDWQLEVLHVPGHSHGHLALYDRKHKAAFVSDAIHGRGCPKADGSLALPVTYFHVDVYLSTLRYLESLAIDNLYSGHWPNMRGEEIRDFIAESRQTVELIDRVVLSSLQTNPAGLTLKQFIDAIANAVGDWPEDNAFQAMFPLKGHLDRLEGLGKVRPLRETRPVVWVRA